MQKLINFIDFHCFDNQLYWRIPQLYTKDEFEVQWLKDKKPNWRYRKVGAEEWMTCSSDELISRLNDQKLNMIQVDNCLRTAVTQQVTFADKVLKEGTDILGKEAVKKAIEDNDRFMDEIAEAISTLINKKDTREERVKKVGLSLVKNEDHA